jgi:hypothetical protein
VHSLYHLGRDPHEQEDLAATEPELTRRLADRLRLARYDLESEKRGE